MRGRGPPIGIYRSGPELEHFLGGLNLELHIGNNSRVPAVRDLLTTRNRTNPESLIPVIEAVAGPRDYLEYPERQSAVVDYLNQRLQFDGYRLQEFGDFHKLMSITSAGPATTSLAKALQETDYDSVRRDFDRALTEAENDPEDAITSACSTVESVCKCILDDMQKPYPAKQDIQGLARDVAKHLDLSPDRTNLPANSENDIRQILGGLITITNGIGALRTHSGDAHGRGKGTATVDARIARLAIHTASTLALFYIETWNRKRLRK